MSHVSPISLPVKYQAVVYPKHGLVIWSLIVGKMILLMNTVTAVSLAFAYFLGSIFTLYFVLIFFFFIRLSSLSVHMCKQEMYSV